MVEWNWRTKEAVNDIWIVVQLFMNHQSQDTHLSSTAIVEFNCLLLSLGFCIPTVAVHAHIAFIFNVFLLITEAEFQNANEADDLGDTRYNKMDPKFNY